MDDSPGTGMRRRRRLARLRSARVVATVGILLGAALTVGLVATVVRDRNARIEAAREQTAALVDGADRLLHFWVRNLERALGGLAADADDDGEPRQVRVSEHAAAIFGFPPRAGLIPIEHFFARLHPEDRPRIEAEFAQSRAENAPFLQQYRLLLPDGIVRWLDVRGSFDIDGRGHPRMAGTMVDVTRHHEVLERVARAEDQFRELFERNPLPFWVFDTETLRFLAVNDAAIASYGYSRAEFLAMTILDIRPRSEVDPLRAAIAERPAHATVDSVWTHLTRDGRRFEVRVHSSAIEFAGRPARLVLAEDVSERLSYERELAWRADHDATTGLLTLPALVARLDARPAGEDYLVAYVRLRDLELVTPMFGGDATDTILREAAGRFAAIGASYGHAAYKPGEAFVVVAVDGRERDRGTMIEELLSATAAPVTSQVGTHALEAWMGLAQGRSGGADGPESVIGHAALAALRAQQENQHTLDYTPVLSEIAGLRLDLVARVRRALARNEFELFFQPIRRLAGRQIVTFEALLRWRQADGSYVPPMHFIPLCEESGLILQVGTWVLEEAARSHKLLEARGRGDIAIAVNVSPVQLQSGDLPAQLQSLYERHGLRRGAIQVELTESVVLRQPEAARALMGALREEGVCLSLDDFGTGFSSLAYLRELPLDYLKIDRSFVIDLGRDPRSDAICHALVALAHGLDLKVVAEGVETSTQADWLQRAGCDKVQGYLFGRPAPLGDFLDTLGEAPGAPDALRRGSAGG